MKHRYKLAGYGYCLRPVKLSDAQFIVNIRLEDEERNKYIHKISPDVKDQEKWLNDYFNRDGDYYFIIENRLTGAPEGLIAFYNENNGSAEWGRWVIGKGSLAAAESVYLLYRIAFEQVGLQELYCRTLADNTTVVSFHSSIGEITRKIHQNMVELNGKLYDAVEQFSDRDNFYKSIAPVLERKAEMVWKRMLKHQIGEMEFHHIGIATRGIDKELSIYTLLGYEKESDFFCDFDQGIRGLFMTRAGSPRIELLENLKDSTTLDKQLKSNQKMYHAGYIVQDIEKVMTFLKCNGAIVISPLKKSAFFGKRICFLVLPNMDMIELIEK